jgi:hypothetical protein
MSILSLIAEVIIRTQKRIFEIPYLMVNWLKVKVLHADKKILQLKEGKLGPYVAIVAIYPGTSTFNSVNRLLGMLEVHGYSVLVVINENSEASRWFEKLSSDGRTLIVRPNIGADFGAYRCGFKYIQSQKSSLRVVLIANDSLYFSKSSVGSLNPLLDPESSINCLYLNFQSVIHAGSMLLKFDSTKLLEDAFWDFWENYFCSNSKRKIIKDGELRLSTLVGVKTFIPMTEVLSTIVLPNPKDDHKLQFLRWTRQSDKGFFDCLSKLDLNSTDLWLVAVRYGLENFQISNSLGLYLTDYFNFPIKMDLVKNGLVTRSSFTTAAQLGSSDTEEFYELMEILDNQIYSKDTGLLAKLRSK